jgi:hypothetical protein
MTRTNKLDSYLFNCNINSRIVIQCIDKFSETITKKTVLILDNSSVHQNKLLLAKKREWYNRGLTIFFLPTYSPHLNLIETLWRFIKDQWLPIEAFANFTHLINSVEEILINFGEKYTINFA